METQRTKRKMHGENAEAMKVIMSTNLGALCVNT